MPRPADRAEDREQQETGEFYSLMLGIFLSSALAAVATWMIFGGGL